MCNYDGKINLVVSSSDNSMRNRIFLGRKLLLNLEHLKVLLGKNQLDCLSYSLNKTQVLALVADQTDFSCRDVSSNLLDCTVDLPPSRALN